MTSSAGTISLARKLISYNISIVSSKTVSSQCLFYPRRLVNTSLNNSFHSISAIRYSDKNDGIDKQHLETFRQQLRSEFKDDTTSSEKPVDDENDPKKRHTKFYREVGKPFIKVVALTFITFYSMKFLYAYLESTDEDLINEKQKTEESVNK